MKTRAAGKKMKKTKPTRVKAMTDTRSDTSLAGFRE
jgi:hypothetical protein